MERPQYEVDGVTLQLLNLATTMIGHSKSPQHVDQGYHAAVTSLGCLKNNPAPSDEDMEKLRTFARECVNELEGR